MASQFGLKIVNQIAAEIKITSRIILKILDIRHIFYLINHESLTSINCTF